MRLVSATTEKRQFAIFAHYALRHWLHGHGAVFRIFRISLFDRFDRFIVKGWELWTQLSVDRVHNTWSKLSSMIKCIALPCLSSIHCLSSRSGLGAHLHAISGSAWPEFFELHVDLKAVT